MAETQGKAVLRKLIHKVKYEKGLNTEQLRQNIQKVLKSGKDRNGYLNAILNDPDKFPEICYLMVIYAAMQGQNNFEKIETNVTDLQKWLIYWLEGHLEHDRNKEHTQSFGLDENYLNKWVEAISELKVKIIADKAVETKNEYELPTLDCFPDAFEKLTIITGTGLANPPVRTSDLFRANVSITDLFFINELKLPKDTRIVSDRFVIDMKPEERVHHFGERHLLLIGGPEVNAVTRKFGKYGFFRFQVEEEEKNFKDFYDNLRNELFQESDCVTMLYELLVKKSNLSSDEMRQHFEKLVNEENSRDQLYAKSNEILSKLGDPNKFTYEDILKVFSPAFLVDPKRNLLIKPRQKAGKDTTLITIAPNFYNRDFNEVASFTSYRFKFVSIIVAGLHRLGTAAGVKKLMYPADFKEYPLGGFLEAVEGTSPVDFERYNKSKCSFITPPYSVASLAEDVEAFNNLSDEEKDKKSALYQIDQEEWLDKKGLDNYLKFLNLFQTKKVKSVESHI